MKKFWGFLFLCIITAGCLCACNGTHLHRYEFHTWIWSEDYSSAVAEFRCIDDNSHTERVSGTISSSSVEADCENDGVTIYVVDVEFEGKKYSDTQTVINTDALGHDYDFEEPMWRWKSLNDVTVTLTCKRDKTHNLTLKAEMTSDSVRENCTETITHIATATYESREFKDTRQETLYGRHTLGQWVEIVPADCEKPGVKGHYVCSVCHNYIDGDRKTVIEDLTIGAIGHSFTKYVYNNDATEDHDGTETAECDHGCGKTDTRTAEGTKLTPSSVRNKLERFVVMISDIGDRDKRRI